jgi:hypothetical protein
MMYDENLKPDENMARAFCSIAGSFCSIAGSLRGIGLGGSEPGAIENTSMEIKRLADGMDSLSSAVHALSESVRDGLEGLSGSPESRGVEPARIYE